MKIIRGLRDLKRQRRSSVVTIGVFDGLHVGHRSVIRKVVEDAKRAKMASVVITFDPHPAKVLDSRHSVPSLISLKHRLRLIEELGVDLSLVANFTGAFSKIPPEKFIKDILIDKFRTKEILAGENFYFGRGAVAGSKSIQALAHKYGFKVKIVAPVRAAGHAVSSSLIRKLIAQGDLRKSEKLLGRRVSVLGTVVKGSGLARNLGCPTANINPHHEAIPPRGVYAVRALFGKKRLKGVLNIGFRPTFYSSRDEEPTVEVHIFGFKGSLYGKEIEVCFIEKLRNERKFNTVQALARQVREDINSAKNILGA
jgi:riboflavin kinase/FMN adenylyltransferase